MKKLMCFIVVLALAPASYGLDSVIGDFEGNVYFWDNPWQLLNGAFNKDNDGRAQISTTIGVTLNNSSMILSNDGIQPAGAQPTIQRGSNGGHGTAYDAGGTFGAGDLENYVSLSLDVTFVASEWGSPKNVMFGKTLTVSSDGPGGTQSFLAYDDVNPSNPGVMVDTGTETHHLTYDFSSYDSTGTTGEASLTWDSDIGGNTVGGIGNFYIDNVVLSSEPPPLIEADQASNPSPADEATDVQREVVLNWTPGDFAPTINGHTLYLSESFNDVNDGIGGITLSASSYTPEPRLDLGKTYYWRIDEVDAAADFTVHPGEVWSFTTEPVAYPIANVIATASSQDNSNTGPENTVNGSGLSNDLHSTESETMWLSGLDGPQPTWIQYEFDKVYKLHEMWVWNSNTDLENSIGFGARDVTIEYSIDGTDYMTLGTTHEFERATAAGDYTHNTTVDLGSIKARYIRLTVNSSWGGWLPQYGLSEVRFFQIPVRARKPYPDSGATGVDVDVTLGFRAGRETAEHNVYFSDDEQAVIDGTAPVTTVIQTNFRPLSLNLGKTYYWRVDEVNNANPDSLWEGDIWSFTAMDFHVVDDMESYNDINEGEPGSNRIYNAWVDGYDDPTNGSTVGHLDPPFYEQTIVHSGNKSMPFTYDNGAGKSEAILTFTSNHDWTVNGVNTLTIWFRGEAANAAENLYVALNGSAVVTNDNPDAALATSWTAWNIDLTRFADQGVNLAKVTSITLGLGNRSNPVTGGAGMIYFDDIRLYGPDL
ncbi:MAG: discoidin domain-containing protein [Planctomycetes bacterium]|nr:discoidin domain-containing protein [Planctomycetota bacterium]